MMITSIRAKTITTKTTTTKRTITKMITTKIPMTKDHHFFFKYLNCFKKIVIVLIFVHFESLSSLPFEGFVCLHMAQFSHIPKTVALLPSVFLSVTLVLAMGEKLGVDLSKLLLTQLML